MSTESSELPEWVDDPWRFTAIGFVAMFAHSAFIYSVGSIGTSEMALRVLALLVLYVPMVYVVGIVGDTTDRVIEHVR